MEKLRLSIYAALLFFFVFVFVLNSCTFGKSNHEKAMLFKPHIGINQGLIERLIQAVRKSFQWET